MFEIVDVFTLSEYGLLRELITQHVKKKVKDLDSLPFYHEVADDETHSSLASKRARVLDAADANLIMTLPAIKNLLLLHPGCQISNVVYDSETQEDRPEFYIRLVRPGKIGDVGSPHCDFWFDEAMRTNYGRGNTLKFWVPIVMEHGKNGLLFYPCIDHDVPFSIKKAGGFRRPLINCDVSELGDPVLPQPDYGQAIKFADDILHCGAHNIGSTTRVSMEITLVKKG